MRFKERFTSSGRKSLARLKRFYQTRKKRGKRLHLKSVALNAKRILMQGNSRSSGVFRLGEETRLGVPIMQRAQLGMG